MSNVHEDGYVLPIIKSHGKQKYYFLERYLGAFTTAMRKKWNELHYIDLFAGAGYAQIDSGDQVIKTSSLIAATLDHPFTHIHAVDACPENAVALRARLSLANKGSKIAVHCGNANHVVSTVLQDIPQSRVLSVTFIDPFGLHINYETVRKISAIRSDLIVLFADHMDILRNWLAYYKDNPKSNLDTMFGSGDWRKICEESPSHLLVQKIREHYIERLKVLGYKYFEHQRINIGADKPLYSLIYASRHAVGAKIWRGISASLPGGQRTLDFQ